MKATHTAMAWSDNDYSSSHAWVCDDHAQAIKDRERTPGVDVSILPSRRKNLECEVCTPGARTTNRMRLRRR